MTLVSFLYLLVATAAAVAQQELSPGKYRAKGEEAMLNGNYQEALQVGTFPFLASDCFTCSVYLHCLFCWITPCFSILA
jgi:hypothetical protein